MSALQGLAAWLYRWRVALSVAYAVGAAALVPSVVGMRVDNDISAWFSRDDPIYQDYDRSARSSAARSRSSLRSGPKHRSPARTRGRRLHSRTSRLPASRSRGHRARSERPARPETRDSPGAESGRRPGNAGAAEERLDLRPLLDLAHRSPAETRTLALGDSLIRDELVSAIGNVTALVVTFDEAALDASRRAILERHLTRSSTRSCPTESSAYYNGSIEINETYNRVTIENQRRFIPPILALTLLAVYALFRSIPRTLS